MSLELSGRDGITRQLVGLRAGSLPEVSLASARPTREQIEQAAYFNYRTRAEKGLPGDPHADWVAAERKLKTD